MIRLKPLCKPTLIAFVTLILCQASLGQINIEVDQTEITVGDPIVVNLSVQNPDGKRVVWPDNEAFAPLEVIRMDTLGAGKSQSSARFTLSAFEPGQIDPKRIPVMLLDDTNADTIFTQMSTVTVNSVLPESDSLPEIRDIHPPVKIRMTFAEMLPYIIGLLIALILGYLGWRFWRKQSQSEDDTLYWTPPPRAPHIVAEEKLIELRDRKLWQNGYVKEFYSELTDILREYLENRYKFNALEMTTFEILESRNKWVVDDENYNLIRQMFTTGDLVKFAKFQSDTHENEKQMQAGLDFVIRTKPDEQTDIVVKEAELVASEASDHA